MNKLYFDGAIKLYSEDYEYLQESLEKEVAKVVSQVLEPFDTSIVFSGFKFKVNLTNSSTFDVYHNTLDDLGVLLDSSGRMFSTSEEASGIQLASTIEGVKNYFIATLTDTLGSFNRSDKSVSLGVKKNIDYSTYVPVFDRAINTIVVSTITEADFLLLTAEERQTTVLLGHVFSKGPGAEYEDTDIIYSEVLYAHNRITDGSVTLNTLSPSIQIPESYVDATPPADVSDRFTGVPATLVDDLNQLRTEFKNVKGTTYWSDATPGTLSNMDSMLNSIHANGISQDSLQSLNISNIVQTSNGYAISIGQGKILLYGNIYTVPISTFIEISFPPPVHTYIGDIESNTSYESVNFSAIGDFVTPLKVADKFIIDNGYVVVTTDSANPVILQRIYGAQYNGDYVFNMSNSYAEICYSNAPGIFYDNRYNIIPTANVVPQTNTYHIKIGIDGATPENIPVVLTENSTWLEICSALNEAFPEITATITGGRLRLKHKKDLAGHTIVIEDNTTDLNINSMMTMLLDHVKVSVSTAVTACFNFNRETLVAVNTTAIPEARLYYRCGMPRYDSIDVNPSYLAGNNFQPITGTAGSDPEPVTPEFGVFRLYNIFVHPFHTITVDDSIRDCRAPIKDVREVVNIDPSNVSYDAGALDRVIPYKPAPEQYAVDKYNDFWKPDPLGGVYTDYPAQLKFTTYFKNSDELWISFEKNSYFVRQAPAVRVSWAGKISSTEVHSGYKDVHLNSSSVIPESLEVVSNDFIEGYYTVTIQFLDADLEEMTRRLKVRDIVIGKLDTLFFKDSIRTMKYIGSENVVATRLIVNGTDVPRIGQKMETDEIIPLTITSPWFSLRNKTQLLSSDTLVDYVPLRRSIKHSANYNTELLTGTIKIANGIVTGTGTDFLNEVADDDILFVNDIKVKVTSRESATSLTIQETSVEFKSDSVFYKVNYFVDAKDYITDIQITKYSINNNILNIWLGLSDDSDRAVGVDILKKVEAIFNANTFKYHTVTVNNPLSIFIDNYNIRVNADGAGLSSYNVDITEGMTWESLATELGTKIGLPVQLTNRTIKILSSTFGAASSVVISDGETSGLVAEFTRVLGAAPTINAVSGSTGYQGYAELVFDFNINPSAVMGIGVVKKVPEDSYLIDTINIQNFGTSNPTITCPYTYPNVAETDLTSKNITVSFHLYRVFNDNVNCWHILDPGLSHNVYEYVGIYEKVEYVLLDNESVLDGTKYLNPLLR